MSLLDLIKIITVNSSLEICDIRLDLILDFLVEFFFKLDHLVLGVVNGIIGFVFQVEKLLSSHV